MNAKPSKNRPAVAAPVTVPAHLARFPFWWHTLAMLAGLESAAGVWTGSPVLLVLAMIGSAITLVSYFPLRRRSHARIAAFVSAELAARQKANP